jgi:hypothetical protein
VKAAILITAAAALTMLLTNLSPPVHGAELQLKMQPADAGQKQDGELILTSHGDRIGGIQIDLEFDPDQFTLKVEPTPSLAEQKKQLAQSQLKRGLVRILIFGPNADSVADTALVQFQLTPLKDTTDQGLGVRASNLVATSPEGQQVHVVLIQPTRGVSLQRR